MATALPTVAVTLIFILWDACRRAQQRLAPPPPPADELPDGDEQVEHRLDCLTVLSRPLPSRRR
jgi:hypothetical protein